MDLDSLTERLEHVSAGYAAREGFDRDDDWFLLELIAGRRRRRPARPTHRPLDATLRDVLAWEETRPEHPHGAGLADEEERDLRRLLAGA